MRFFRKKIPFILLLLPLFFLVLVLPAKAFAFELLPINITPAYKVLSETTGVGGSIKTVWQNLINLVNGFVIIVIIVVAFAEILRLNINTYGVKKLLPTLIFAVIAANFSFLFCRLMIDFANIVMAGIIHGTSSTELTTAMDGGKGTDGWASPTNTAAFGTMNKDGAGAVVFWFLIMQLLLIASGVIIYVLAFLFFIRLWVIYFLVALAPIAFMATILPQSKSLFNQWMSNFFKWVFMPVVSVFWIWLGSTWLKSIAPSRDTGWFLQILFGGVCFYLAITTPFKMGGAIMNSWGGLGKKIWNRTGEAAWKSTGGAIGTWAKGGVNNYYARQKGFLKESVMGTKTGKWFTQAAAGSKLKNELPGMMKEKRESDATKFEYIRAYKDHVNGVKKMPPSMFKRIGAGLRKYQAEEASTTLMAADPTDIMSNLQRMHALDGNDKLKSEAELAKLPGDDFVMVKANIKKLIQLRGNTLYGAQAREIFGGKYKDRRGDPVEYDGLFSSAEEARKAAGRDLAYGIREMDQDLNASSAVGTVVQQTQKELSKTLGSPANAQKVVNAMQFGNGNLNDAMKAINVNIVGVNPAGRTALQNSFNLIRGEKMDRINELKEIGNQNVEDRAEGIKMIAEHSPLSGSSLNDIRNQINGAKNALGEGKTTDEVKHSLGALGTTIVGENDEKIREAINTRISHLEAGVEHFEQLDKRLKDKNFDPRVRERVSESINTNNGEEYVNKIREGMKKDVEASAHATVAAELATHSLASNPSMTVGQMTSPEGMETLTEAINGMRHDLQANRGGDVNEITKLNPMDMGVKQMFAESVNNSIKQGVVEAGTKMASVMNNKAFLNNMSNAMKRAMQTTPIQATVKNIPKAQTSTPPIVNPGDKPNVA